MTSDLEALQAIIAAVQEERAVLELFPDGNYRAGTALGGPKFEALAAACAACEGEGKP